MQKWDSELKLHFTSEARAELPASQVDLVKLALVKQDTIGHFESEIQRLGAKIGGEGRVEIRNLQMKLASLQTQLQTGSRLLGDKAQAQVELEKQIEGAGGRDQSWPTTSCSSSRNTCFSGVSRTRRWRRRCAGSAGK